MSDDEFNFNFDKKHLTCLPFFDIDMAIEEIGLDFESFSSNNYDEFLLTYIQKYAETRKYFIRRDFYNFKRGVHAVKNSVS